MVNVKNYLNLFDNVSLGVTMSDGQDRHISISPIIIKESDETFRSTGIFKLYVDNFGLDIAEFDDLSDFDTVELSDEKNPDYLGRILFDNKGHWIYDGDLLPIDEQEQVGNFIATYEEGDVDY